MSESFDRLLADMALWASGTPTCDCHKDESIGLEACKKLTDMIFEVKEAHDREIAEALCDACDQCDRTDKRAHEHEIEQLRKTEYARGYEDGRRSMDAEHRAVAMRLRGLSFDGGSHENLNKIAYAIYPCATGWTVESCEGLRDKIIELLGGVHDGVPDNVSCCACGDDRDSRDGQSEAVDVDDSVSDVRADVPAADGVADSPFPQVTYDVLGNERHKAVRALRELQRGVYGGGDLGWWKWFGELADAVGVVAEEQDAPSIGELYTRLIYLLGGDEPTLREFAANLSQASVDAMSRRAKSCKGGETIKSDGECDGKIMENGENHQIEGTITDELRERIACVCKISGLSGEKLYGIADRIDEQLNTIRQNDYDEWQLQTDKMRAMLTEQRDEARAKVLKLESENAEWRRGAERDADKLESLTDAYNDAVAERDDLLELLKDAVTEYQLSQNGWAYGAVVSETITLESENNELQAKLEEADAAIANWREREKSFAESERLREELQKMLDEMQEQREHWADEATKMYRLFFSHDEYCVPDSPSEMFTVAVRTLQEKYDGAKGAIRHLTGQWSKAVKQRKELQAKLDAIREVIDG